MEIKTFKEFTSEPEENGIDYILIEIAEELIDEAFLNEGKWQESKIKNYWLRVDSSTDNTQQRHVHIANKKHLSTKNKQVSWNEDGSRHDKKSFNTKLASNKSVQKIARSALNLQDNVILESLQELRFSKLLESYQGNKLIPIRLIVKG